MQNDLGGSYKGGFGVLNKLHPIPEMRQQRLSLPIPSTHF
jgi:hypothetical protein